MLDILNAALLAVLWVSAYLDMRTRTIPNSIPILLMALAVFRMIAIGTMLPAIGILPAILIAGMFYTTNNSPIGGADIKCMAGIGVYLGLLPALESYMIAFVLAIIVSVVKKILTQDNEKGGIPLCVYLAIGATITILAKT